MPLLQSEQQTELKAMAPVQNLFLEAPHQITTESTRRAWITSLAPVREKGS